MIQTQKYKKKKKKKKWLKPLIGKKTWLVFSVCVSVCVLVLLPVNDSPDTLLGSHNDITRRCSSSRIQCFDRRWSWQVCRVWSLRQLCGGQTDAACFQWATAGRYKLTAGVSKCQQHVSTSKASGHDLQLSHTVVHSMARCEILPFCDTVNIL